MSDRTKQVDVERRSRPGFRALIDEMLMQIRETSRKEVWTEEERQQAEADLERIMAQVRREALREARRAERAEGEGTARTASRPRSGAEG